jgi:tetratricopeptide (TPR) repeat protein
VRQPLGKWFTGVLGIAILLMAQSGYSADKWISIRSKNFLFVGNASESQIRRVGRNLEEFRAGFSLLFPAISQKAPSPITVIVFKDDGSFRPFKPLYQGKPANMAGYFQPGADVNFIALSAEGETPHVIYHEFVHSLTKDNVQLPPWASEGLAEFYGKFEIEPNGKEMLLGRPMEEHIVTLRQQLLPLGELFAVNHGSPFYNEQSKQGIFYAESWALMHYLMLGDNQQHRPQLQKFLQLLSTDKPIDASFAEAFQTDYATFERGLTAYIRRYAFPAIRFSLQNKIDFNTDMQVMPVSDAQVQYYLGDLLLHINRLDAAEPQLTKAMSLDPKFGPSYASIGLLRVRQSKNEEALKFLTQAVQSDPNNYLVHYYFAYMTQMAGQDPASGPDKARFLSMKEHLKRSIALAPEYPEAYGLLGYVALNLGEEIPETEQLLKNIVNALPARRDLRLTLAELMVMNKEAAAAKFILTTIKNGPEDDVIRQQAESLFQEIEARIQNEEALREFEERRRSLEVQSNRALAESAADSAKDAKGPGGPPKITRREAGSSSNGRVAETMKAQPSRPAGPQIQGLLTSVECADGVTLHLSADNKVIDLHTDDPSKIEFVSYTAGVSNSIACGAVNPALPVAIVYRPGNEPRFLGEPLRVEFIEKK